MMIETTTTVDQITNIYQFTKSNHVPPNSPMPSCEMFTMFQKLEQGRDLTREEKDKVADKLYGTFGAASSTYRHLGFAAPFHMVLPRFLVKQYNRWEEYYSPDRTALKKALARTGTIQEIIQV